MPGGKQNHIKIFPILRPKNWTPKPDLFQYHHELFNIVINECIFKYAKS